MYVYYWYQPQANISSFGELNRHVDYGGIPFEHDLCYIGASLSHDEKNIDDDIWYVMTRPGDYDMVPRVPILYWEIETIELKLETNCVSAEIFRSTGGMQYYTGELN